jgi:hypothetical protein
LNATNLTFHRRECDGNGHGNGHDHGNGHGHGHGNGQERYGNRSVTDRSRVGHGSVTGEKRYVTGRSRDGNETVTVTYDKRKINFIIERFYF